jgi:Gram-negative bacterial TonB protein C-terminal/Tetratricopeptide repeat
MFPYVLALFVTLQSATQPVPQDEIKDGLLRAESLYFEAKFVESIQLLARVNDALVSRPDRLQDKIATKLQLALSNIGLNDTASAKTFLTELFALDPEYVLDAKQFSPKVVALANDAKNEQSRIRCETALQDARRSLASGDSNTLMNIHRTMRPKCAGLAEVEPDAAELLYKTGLTAYKQGDFSSALKSFRSAQKLSPKHDLAAQYIELTEGQLQVAQDRLVLQWQKNFDTRNYRAAASDYRQIVTLGDVSPQTITRVTQEYRKAMTSLVDNWNRTCTSGDSSGMNQIRGQVAEMIPEPTFADDLQAQIKTCNAPAPVPATGSAPKVAARLDSKTDPVVEANAKQDATSKCLQMDPQLALARLKTRVDPEIPAGSRAYLQNSKVTVVVKARIDEAGNVTPTEVSGINTILNNAVRNAVERWKFTPVADRNGPRCVNTEIPVVIGK